MSTAQAHAARPSWHPAEGIDKVTGPQLASSTARLDQVVASGDPLAILGAVEEAVKSGCIRTTRPAAGPLTNDVRAFAEAFTDALAALPIEAADAVTALRLRRVIAGARAQAGKGALLLSGGGILGHYHVGVVRALVARDLLPTIVTGSSAGAYIAGLMGTRNDAELAELFADGAPQLASEARDALQAAEQLDSQSLRALVTKLVPDMTFAEAARHSKHEINIVVAAQKGVYGGLVLSARTTPDVLVRDGIMASCAVPFLFDPVQLRARDSHGEVRPYRPGHRWIDGSIYADLPIAWLEETYGVDRTIASMVNPMVLPFMTDPERNSWAVHHVAHHGVQWMKLLVDCGATMFRPLACGVPPLANALELCGRVARQNYRADITITPSQRFHDPRGIIGVPDATQLRTFIADGELSANRHIDAIKAALEIEHALDRFERPA